MFIKWIVCEVKENLKKDFSIAQEQWIETQNCDGFYAQVGGFDLKNKNIAYIVSFWDTEQSLKLFMKNIHDKVILNSNQAEFYNSINVRHFTLSSKIENEFKVLVDTLSKSKFLQVIDSFVKPNKFEHFKSAQKDIWISEMKNNKGISGGLFLEDVNNSLKYLVSIFWNSEINNKDYLETMVSKNIKKNDIESYNDVQIKLIDSWKIIKSQE